MDDAGRRAGGSRRARLESRRQRREQNYGRFLGLAALGTLIPGLGLFAAGRRGWGKFLLSLVVLSVIGLGFVLWRVPLTTLLRSAVDRSHLGVVATGLVILAVSWLLVAIASFKALDTGRMSGAKRFGGAAVVTLVASAVIAPMAVGAQYAWTQSSLIGSISRESSTTPDLDVEDPWADKPRVNVLLLGSDAGVGRDGARPDTIILASIDTQSGDTVMFSLPRNLERVPFADGHPLAQRFPGGFTDYIQFNDAYFLNAVYNHAPPEVPAEVFGASENPGADATKLAVGGALGLDVDYYVMADLSGFQQIVDAMGGITIDVNYPIPIASKKREDGGVGCTQPRDWILPEKNKHLNGNQALWFARARCAPDHPDYAELYAQIDGNPVVDDWNRMERQRCVMGAVAQNADPMSLLPRFQQLAAATEDNIETDIPPEMFPAFAELGLRVKGGALTSLPFTRDVINPANPDYAQIHLLVQEALNPLPDVSDSVEASTANNDDPAQEDDATDDDPASDAGADGSVGDDTGDTGPAEDEVDDPAQAVDVTTAC